MSVRALRVPPVCPVDFDPPRCPVCRTLASSMRALGEETLEDVRPAIAVSVGLVASSVDEGGKLAVADHILGDTEWSHICEACWRLTVMVVKDGKAKIVGAHHKAPAGQRHEVVVGFGLHGYGVDNQARVRLRSVAGHAGKGSARDVGQVFRAGQWLLHRIGGSNYGGVEHQLAVPKAKVTVASLEDRAKGNAQIIIGLHNDVFIDSQQPHSRPDSKSSSNAVLLHFINGNALLCRLLWCRPAYAHLPVGAQFDLHPYCTLPRQGAI
mmetsp:Transcript_46881/g.101825  ORF Transcript_46881/g.101825 Transcript_46881/m.101825 type:complete len:267 (-) Transcript_46881:130-930(-)